MRRPFKICDSRRSQQKGVVVRSLEELKRVADEKLDVGANCRIFLESDGTEIEDDDYLSFVKEDSKLMVTRDGDGWTAERSRAEGEVRVCKTGLNQRQGCPFDTLY